ncbi:MAG: ankyrin repeat domain-containing protein [Acidobacteriota bacterium]
MRKKSLLRGIAAAFLVLLTAPAFGQEFGERWDLLGDSPENLAAIEKLEEKMWADQTSFFFAMNQSDLDWVRLFLDAGLDPNSLMSSSDGQTEFEVSVLQEYLDSYGTCENEGTLEVLGLLLERGADPNRPRPNNGSTPLIDVSYRDCAPHTKLLLEYGADPNVRNTSGKSPLDMAITFDQPSQVKALVEGGARLEPSREALIQRVRGYSNPEVRNYLESLPDETATAKPKPRPSTTSTPTPESPATLAEALKEWDLEATKKLLDAGASAREPIRDEPPLLFLTGQCFRREPNLVQFIQLFTSYGADVSVKDDTLQETPLARAVQRCDLDVVEALLAAAADPNVRNLANQTPLLSAVMGGKVEVVEALLNAGAVPDKDSKFFAKSKPEIQKLLKKKR